MSGMRQFARSFPGATGHLLLKRRLTRSLHGISYLTSTYDPRINKDEKVFFPSQNIHGHKFSVRAFSTKESKDDSNKSTAEVSESKEKKEEEPEFQPQPPMDPINAENFEFQAETRQLLDIVTNSLYTDREVFLRELVSNASDALEKLRHIQAAEGVETIDPDVPMEIRIETDELNGTVTISDTGIGLTREDMVKNLGTIARSGSKAFVQELTNKKDGGALDASRGIIGKFGVGFYSAFMVGEKVQVRSKPARKENESDDPLLWSSEGLGQFEIGELDPEVRQDRGTSVVIHLKIDDIKFSDEKTVEAVLKKYSNFVNFPIFLNGNRVNTMEAVWAKEPKEVEDETHNAFYKFIANAYDVPLDRLHFRADAPLEIKALFYIPSFHSEKYGMGRMEPGVSLYSRKVLIDSKSKDIVPEWMRFLKGVVDSEDLPLSISREKPQDTALIAKLRKVLTRKFISHLSTMARKETDKYKEEFYKEYSFFLKEGICQDFEFQEPLSKLLYFESSKMMAGELTSLDEYVSRCVPEQKEIYYLCAPTRELALESPYLEVFEKADREVLFVYTSIDEFVMANLEKFEGRSLVTAEKSDIDLGDSAKDDDKPDSSSGSSQLTDAEASEFCTWFQDALKDKVSVAKTTKRLDSSPAIITNSESAAMRRMMRFVDTQERGAEKQPLPKQQVEINPGHGIIVGINAIRKKEPVLAKVCAEQIFDNCLVAAGIMDDGRSMLPRLNDILLSVINGADALSKTVQSNDDVVTGDVVTGDVVTGDVVTDNDGSDGDSSDDDSSDDDGLDDDGSDDDGLDDDGSDDDGSDDDSSDDDGSDDDKEDTEEESAEKSEKTEK